MYTTLVNVAQYILLRSFSFCLLVLSLENALKVGRFLGRLAYRLAKKYRVRGYHHLDMVYQARRTPQEIKRLLIKVFEHFGMVLAEIVFFPRKITLQTYPNYVKVEGLHFFQEALSRGKGLIFMGAHLGNWELTGYLLGMFGYSLTSLARFMPNPLVDQYINYFREYRGQRIIDRAGALKEMMRVLKNNQGLGILADQDAREAGVFVEFMGRPASTIRAPALLKVRLGSPIIQFHCYRSYPNKFQYKFIIDPPLEITPSNEPESDIVKLTQSFTARIESVIREHPEQWLWLHRRWKTKSPGRPRNAAPTGARRGETPCSPSHFVRGA